MNQPFNAKEVKNAVTSMSNNKSAGCDNVKCELLKYGDKIIFEDIAEILNSIAKTGQFPAEIKKGILVPLPKPGKPKGPPENCRPIILLSVIRKNLAIIMIIRTSKKDARHYTLYIRLPTKTLYIRLPTKTL